MTASAAMSFCRQRAAAQGGGTVPHQLRELARQLSQGMGTPGGLCLGDHRFLQQEHGQCGNAAEQRTHQIKAGKPQKPPQCAGKGAERTGQHADLGAVGGHGKIPFFLPGLLQAVVGQSGIGAGKHGVGQGVQPHCRTNQEKAGRKCHEQAAQHCQDAGCPDAELCAAFGFDPVADGDDDIEVVIVHIVDLSICGSVGKFCPH